jgi:hypothetical protein
MPESESLQGLQETALQGEKITAVRGAKNPGVFRDQTKLA